MKGNGPWQRQIDRDGQIRRACLFACTHSLSYKLDVTIVTCHLLMRVSQAPLLIVCSQHHLNERRLRWPPVIWKLCVIDSLVGGRVLCCSLGSMAEVQSTSFWYIFWIIPGETSDNTNKMAETLKKKRVFLALFRLTILVQEMLIMCLEQQFFYSETNHGLKTLTKI